MSTVSAAARAMQVFSRTQSSVKLAVSCEVLDMSEMNQFFLEAAIHELAHSS